MFDSRARPTAVLAAVLAIGLVACDPGGDDMGAGDEAAELMCDSEERTDDFAIDLTKMGQRHSVAIAEAMPAQPIRGDNTWTVLITDESGTPVEGITLDARPWMPDHGHGSSVEETVTDMGEGMYMLDPLNLFMAGYWEVALEITDADGVTDEVMIAICVE